VAKALTIKQPWAWAIIYAGKDVENRSKPTRYRGPLLIHAGLQDSLEGWEWLDEMGVPLPVEPPTGGIIGLVDLVDCVQGYDSCWAMDGYYHWVLANPRPWKFVPMLGKLSMFDVDLR
jgi:hypothetical protein